MTGSGRNRQRIPPVCFFFFFLRVAQLYEEVRKSLEQCDVQKDLDHFINLRRTGDKPAGRTSGPAPPLSPCGPNRSRSHTNQSWFPVSAPVLYENFYSAQRSPTPQHPQPARYAGRRHGDDHSSSCVPNPNQPCVFVTFQEWGVSKSKNQQPR